jgi:hypothetical protein
LVKEAETLQDKIRSLEDNSSADAQTKLSQINSLEKAVEKAVEDLKNEKAAAAKQLEEAQASINTLTDKTHAL